MHIMVDIETVATCQSARVIAIGACAFELDTVQTPIELEASAFLVSIPEWSYKDYRSDLYTTDPKTLEWWASQPQEARDALTINPSSHEGAFRMLTSWMRDYLSSNGTVWANSPTFDLAILRYHYGTLGIQAPWHYRQERDCRTMFHVFRQFGVASAEYFKPGLLHHRADHDAIRQAIAIQEGYAGLRQIMESNA